MKNIKRRSPMILLFCVAVSVVQAQFTQNQDSDYSKFNIDKVDTKLISVHKQLEEASNPQQQIGYGLYAMIERNLESLIEIQETVLCLDKLSNALFSAQPLEEAVDWFKPRESGLHLCNNAEHLQHLNVSP